MTRGLTAGRIDTTVGAALHSAVGEAQLHAHASATASAALIELESKQALARKHTFGSRAVMPQVAGLSILTAVWLVLVLVVFRLDVGLYATAEYVPSTALLLGALIVLVTAGLGLVLGELLGLTHFLHEVPTLRRATRGALTGLTLAVFLALALLVLPVLSATRSAAQFGPQVDADQKVAFAATQPGSDPTEGAAARIALQRSQTRETDARLMDQRVAVLASLGDMLFAPAALRLLGASSIPIYGLRQRRVRRRVNKAEAAAIQVVTVLNTRLSAASLSAGADLDHVERALAERRARRVASEVLEPAQLPQPAPTAVAAPDPSDIADERQPPASAPDPWDEF